MKRDLTPILTSKGVYEIALGKDANFMSPSIGNFLNKYKNKNIRYIMNNGYKYDDAVDIYFEAYKKYLQANKIKENIMKVGGKTYFIYWMINRDAHLYIPLILLDDSEKGLKYTTFSVPLKFLYIQGFKLRKEYTQEFYKLLEPFGIELKNIPAMYFNIVSRFNAVNDITPALSEYTYGNNPDFGILKVHFLKQMNELHKFNTSKKFKGGCSE